MISSICSYVSRYVVPFYYNYENDGYGKIRRLFFDNESSRWEPKLPNDGKWEEAGFWENYNSGKSRQAEMDLYSYLPGIFLEECNGKKVDFQNLGSSFVYRTGGKILDLKYQNKEKKIPFECKDLGVILLRNGIGFIWYEVQFKTIITPEDYVRFQYNFKELARTHDQKFFRKIGHDREKNEDVYEPFILGTWLSKLVQSDRLKISFWAERITGRKTSEAINIPDKALLFQYLFVDGTTQQEAEQLLFQIANGYDVNYNFPIDIQENIYRPFGNTGFYISNAGMACLVINERTNQAFFKQQFREKYIRDYFFIYILLAYQSYSCAHYSRLLTKLPADEKLFNKKSKYVDILESLNGQINLFLVKSIFESVSNVNHQNGVYRYGKSELHIVEDIESLTVGLDALKDLEREKRDRKVDKAITAFGFLVVISALVDGITLVDRIIEGFHPLHIAVIAVILAFTVYLIITLLWNSKK